MIQVAACCLLAFLVALLLYLESILRLWYIVWVYKDSLTGSFDND